MGGLLPGKYTAHFSRGAGRLFAILQMHLFRLPLHDHAIADFMRLVELRAGLFSLLRLLEPTLLFLRDLLGMFRHGLVLSKIVSGLPINGTRVETDRHRDR